MHRMRFRRIAIGAAALGMALVAAGCGQNPDGVFNGQNTGTTGNTGTHKPSLPPPGADPGSCTPGNTCNSGNSGAGNSGNT
jgi:hypothetical protein